MLFEEAAREFLVYHEVYSTDRKTMRLRLRVLVRHLGGMQLTQIGPAEIHRMFGERLAEGIERSTLNRLRAALSVLFNWAIERGLHPGPNPILKVRKFRESPGRTRYLTPAEADRLWLAAPAHLRGIISVALHTGGRLQEILGLSWGDLDLEARVVTFSKESAKGRKLRTVPMSPALHVILSGLRRGRPDQRVFTWRGQPLRSVRSGFEAAARKAGLQSVVFHTLRHTFSSWYVQNGGNIERLQVYLGHSTIELTQRYAHLSREVLEDGVRFIGPPRAKIPPAEEL